MPTNECNGIRRGNIDGVIVPIEKLPGGKTRINPEIMKTCFGIIELKKPYQSKSGENCIYCYVSQLFLQIISATESSLDPVCLIYGDLNEFIGIWFFISIGGKLILVQNDNLKPAVALKMMHLWISVICDDTKLDSAHFNELRAQILAGQVQIKAKYAEIKSKQSLEIISVKENVEPPTEEDDIEATVEQVNTNMFIFNYIRDQKYVF